MHLNTSRPPIGELAAQLAPHATAIAEAMTGQKPSSRSTREARFGRKGSLSVVISGPDRGAFYDHEAGRGGDTIDLVAHLRGTSLAEAAAWARAFLGTGGTAPRQHPQAVPTPEAKPPDPPDPDRTAGAVALWHDAEERIDGTPADLYLRGRGLDPSKLLLHAGLVGWPPPLRFHRGIGAMLVAVNDAQAGAICAVQRIFLHRDGTPKRRPDGQKIKLALGPTGNGSASRLAWAPDPQGRWGIAEGAETALAAAQLFGFPVVASLGAANMPKVQPPSWATSVIVCADHDQAGMRAAQETATALAAQGLPVAIRRPTRPGTDFADVLQARRAAA